MKKAELTTRERFVRTLTGQDVDRVPFIKIFGGTNQILSTWEMQYPKLSQYIDELLGFEGGYRGWRITPVNFNLSNIEADSILFEDEIEIITQSGIGTVRRSRKNGDYHGHIEEYPVKTMQDWDKIRSKHLNPYDVSRIPPDWENLVELYKNRTFPLQLTSGGVYGFLRNMMGDEGLCYALYDQPELIDAITTDYTNMLLKLWEVLCKDVQFDLIESWEDMASKNGSIISPASFKRFIAPQFRKMRSFADAHNIPILLVDSDGNTNDLAYWMHECGVNAMYPFEVGAGCNPQIVLKDISSMGALGCLEKNSCALGDDAIEEQMEIACSLIRLGRCIPGPDHFVLENVPFSGYKKFMNRLREVILTTKPGT